MSSRKNGSNDGEKFGPEMRRASVGKLELKVCEISDTELDLLEKGTPSPVFLTFAVFLLSLAASSTVTLLTIDVPAGKTFDCFFVVTVLGYIVGFLLLCLWGRDYRPVRSLAAKIRERLPPEGQGRIPLSVPADDVACERTFELLDAHYGSEERQIEVTRQVARMVKNQALALMVSNKIAGDPHPGAKKTLTIIYVSHGKSYKVKAEEGETLALPE